MAIVVALIWLILNNFIVIIISETPSTMSPPHSMFISESVDGQAKPEPMNEEYASLPQGNAKVS